jgi:phage/plasmid-associated DNA primase
MDGKKINICSGLDGIKEAKFKQIIDGEKMPCRQPYGEPYLTTSLPMFVCETNNIPSKLSDGILRRLSIINFEVEVKNHDYSLGQKLSKESDGIKEWAGIK